MKVSEAESTAPTWGAGPAQAAPPWGGLRPRRLWLLLALQALLMLGLSILYPPFQNPDEASHVDYVLAHRQGQWFDGPGERQFQSGVLKAFSQVPNTQFQTHVASPPPARKARLSFDALGAVPANSLLTNQMVQHPPLYYGLAAGYSSLLTHFSQQSFDRQVFALRFLSLLLLLPVPMLIFGAARRIGGSDNLALLAALIPLSIPTYLRTGASVTNDSLLILAGTVLSALLVRVAWGDLSRRTAIWVGLAWSVALLTKGFALVFPPVIVLAYLLGAHGGLAARVRSAWLPALISGAIGAVLGGWWWLRNLIVYGTLQPQGWRHLNDALRQVLTGPDRPGGTELGFFGNFFRLLSQRGYGSIGLLDIPTLNPEVLATMSVIFVLLLVLGVAVAIRPLRDRFVMTIPVGWSFGRAVLLILPALLILSVMYFGARSIYLHGQQLSGAQIRYLLPGLLGLVLLAAVALHTLLRRFDRWLAPALLSATVVFLGLSVNRVLDLEMSSSSANYEVRMRDALHFVVGWAPFSKAVTVAFLVVTVTVVLISLMVFWVSAVHEPQTSTDQNR